MRRAAGLGDVGYDFVIQVFGYTSPGKQTSLNIDFRISQPGSPFDTIVYDAGASDMSLTVDPGEKSGTISVDYRSYNGRSGGPVAGHAQGHWSCAAI